ncbi:MAG: bifunctional hydroxymethylpyrimidine kinase/phosphomethylpyrimidine kinase [Lachnospiraceae bacterium]|nr:bifunctional hydroxymethylpyrimidine kinase/phosphomethylpyrimidine kinase [Lachnospiraceae bacterium]
MNTVLTIAGSDPSGGAGIQADIKTLSAHGVYAMSAVTALTAQNTTGVYGILEVPPEFLEKQLDCVFSDIFPDAVKIGMTPSAALIRVIAQKLAQYQARHVVLDPRMISTSGTRLIAEAAVEGLAEALFPLAELITPNLPEAETLSGSDIRSHGDMELAALRLHKHFGCQVLIKGGHFSGAADDVLCLDGTFHWFSGRRINNPNSHGTGCTLSSAIAANLAAGMDLPDAVREAKTYLTGALASMLALGHGRGPLNHLYRQDRHPGR